MEYLIEAHPGKTPRDSKADSKPVTSSSSTSFKEPTITDIFSPLSQTAAPNRRHSSNLPQKPAAMSYRTNPVGMSASSNHKGSIVGGRGVAGGKTRGSIPVPPISTGSIRTRPEEAEVKVQSCASQGSEVKPLLSMTKYGSKEVQGSEVEVPQTTTKYRSKASKTPSMGQSSDIDPAPTTEPYVTTKVRVLYS